MNKVPIGPRPFLTPMPAVLVGSNVDGKANFMAVAWAGVACMNPPMIAVAINKSRHTEKGIVENGTFSVNIPAAKDAVETDYCGIVSGSKEDKSKLFEVSYGKLGNAPLIQSFPVCIECEVRHTLELGSHNLHVGEIMEIHVAEECMSGGNPDIKKIDPLVYSDASYFRLGETVGKAFSMGKGLKR